MRKKAENMGNRRQGGYFFIYAPALIHWFLVGIFVSRLERTFSTNFFDIPSP